MKLVSTEEKFWARQKEVRTHWEKKQKREDKQKRWLNLEGVASLNENVLDFPCMFSRNLKGK